MKVLGIEYAPLNVPLDRRLQTLAAFGYFFTLILSGPLSSILFVYLLFYTHLYWIPCLYLAYWFCDRHVAERGARASMRARRWAWWAYNRDFFPAKLVKTAELDPKENYVLGVFPHGLFSFGAALSFGTEAMDVTNVFPGIQMSMITLHSNFKMPVVREILLWLGTCSASKESLNYLLSDPQGGRAAVIIVGGAAESMKCRPGLYHIYLKKRKGFIKLALKNGSSLVPVFSFGENDLYDQVSNPEGSWLRWAQDICKKYTGIAPIIIIGRGIFQYTYGLLPRRKPIHTVVGKPMKVEKTPDPTQRQIDELHQHFMDNLAALFEEHKHKYVENPDSTKLVIE